MLIIAFCSSTTTMTTDDELNEHTHTQHTLAVARQVPDNDTPPPWGWVHMCVRHDAAAQQQVLKFVETGCVENFCHGPCERKYCRA